MLFLLVVLALLADFYLLWRNDQVYRERMRVLDAISAWASIDIDQDREWQWRYDQYESISYWSMVLSVRPVESFYEGLACTKG